MLWSRYPVFLLLFALSPVLPFSVSPSFAAQKPDWVSNNGISEQYPATQYVTGFGVGESASKAERVAMAEQRAGSDLSARFIQQIQSQILSDSRDTDGTVSEDFRVMLSSYTQFRIIGAYIQRWDDAREERAYSLAVLERRGAVLNYTQRVRELEGEVARQIAEAEACEKADRLRDAITAYRKACPRLLELGEARTIVSLLGGSLPPQNPVYSTERIEGRIGRLRTAPVDSLQAAAELLAEQLASQTNTTLPVVVYPLAYRDSDFSSDFAANFKSILEQPLAVSYRVHREGTIRPGQQAILTLTGTYWVGGETTDVRVCLSDPVTGAKLAVAWAKIPVRVILSAGLNPEPPGYAQAMALLRDLATNAVPSALSVDVWTSRGDRYLVFYEDEEFTVKVRVNKPCYLQVVDGMSVGTTNLLYENFYIDMSKVNREVTLPDTLVVAPPFGVERLIVYARTTPFDKEPVTTATFEGETYSNILTRNLKAITGGYRGFKPKTNAPVELADRWLTVTTIRKPVKP